MTIFDTSELPGSGDPAWEVSAVDTTTNQSVVILPVVTDTFTSVDEGVLEVPSGNSVGNCNNYPGGSGGSIVFQSTNVYQPNQCSGPGYTQTNITSSLSFGANVNSESPNCGFSAPTNFSGGTTLHF
jgi:hypothetical protein